MEIKRSFSYSAEENCILSDDGVDSKHGRVHYPHDWEGKATKANKNGPDIFVAQPVRAGNQRLGKVSPHEAERMGSGRVGSNESGEWGSETVNLPTVSTGNKERDDLMNRARAILFAHSTPEERLELSRIDSDSSDPGEKQEDNVTKKLKSRTHDQDLLEDGVAPLGGQWPERTGRPLPLSDMLKDPMNNLHDIHDEASTQLQVSLASLSTPPFLHGKTNLTTRLPYSRRITMPSMP